MADCLFCRIVAGETPATIVYQDDRVVAFKDITPQAATHVLVVPRRHIATLNDLGPGDDQLIGEMVRAAAGIAKILFVVFLVIFLASFLMGRRSV